MSCAEVQDSLTAYLLHELGDTDRATVERHLASGCPACLTELHQLTESIDLLWQAVPNHPLPDSLRERILATCSNTPCSPAFKMQNGCCRTTKPQLRLHVPAIGELLLAFAAGVLLMATWRFVSPEPPQFDRSLPTAAFGPQNESVIRSFGTFDTPDSLEMSEQQYRKTRFVSLHRPAKVNDLSGHLLWDKLNREIHIYCFGLSAPPAGMQYTLWLVGVHQTVRILDELKVDEFGECRSIAQWPEGDFQYVQVALSSRGTLDSLKTTEVTLTSDAMPSNEL